jgi:histidine ammonia-lyase
MKGTQRRLPSEPLVTFGDRSVGISDVVSLARQTSKAQLSSEEVFHAKIKRGSDYMDHLLANNGFVYGVTTGYGDSCTVPIPKQLAKMLPEKLYGSFGCGLGRFLDAQETRALLAARLASLVRGMSGVSKVQSTNQPTALHKILKNILGELWAA